MDKQQSLMSNEYSNLWAFSCLKASAYSLSLKIITYIEEKSLTSLALE
jgi:hypothetical protein